MLMTAVDVSSEEKGRFCEKESREQILQKSKIQLPHLHFKKATADPEAKQKALTRPALSLERTILQFICKVLFSVAFMLFRPWE